MSRKEPLFAVILAAVPAEIKPLVRMTAERETRRLLGAPFTVGKIMNRPTLIGAAGIGKVNAAAVTASILERFHALHVFNTGCAGAYEPGGLRLGDVIVTDAALCGDEGILTKDGPLSSRGIGIPIAVKDGEELFDVIPSDGRRMDLFRRTLPPGLYRSADAGVAPCEDTSATGAFRLAYGPSLTVGLVSGDPETALERFRLRKAMAENMEGSAVAQTCLRFGVPFLECRGISNIAGDRRKERWEMGAAIDHCLAVVLKLFEVLISNEETNPEI